MTDRTPLYPCCGYRKEHFRSCGERIEVRRVGGRKALVQVLRDGSAWVLPGQRMPKP